MNIPERQRVRPNCLEPQSAQVGSEARISGLYAATSAAMLGIIILTAMSDDVYGATLPASLPHHTILRKIYALAAFAVAGAIVAPLFSPRARTLKAVVAIALLSAVIEIGQRLLGSGEWWRWMAFDVASGAVGGFIGAFIRARLVRSIKAFLQKHRVRNRAVKAGQQGGLSPLRVSFTSRWTAAFEGRVRAALRALRQ